MEFRPIPNRVIGIGFRVWGTSANDEYAYTGILYGRVGGGF